MTSKWVSAIDLWQINCIDDDKSIYQAYWEGDVFVSKIDERGFLQDTCSEPTFINLRERKYHSDQEKSNKNQYTNTGR